MFIYWSLMLMIMSVSFLIMLCKILITENLIIFEYYLMTVNNLDIKLYFMFDWISVMFVMVVLFISSMVILYSNEYMKHDKNKSSFCLIVLLFVMSMILLILMPNMLMIILGWDGLGLVSYCLVIHYQSINSYNSGMMTIISNRVGDVMIILSLIFFVSFGSFDFLTAQNFELICGILILVAALTKSAQIPFSAWLPAAMAAPTPVSSLVHSSTLVTAGVYLLLRFYYLFNMQLYSEILMKISLLTMLMAGINAFFENDFKKIIAFSTLSQLSLMMISISLNMIEMAFFHLIMHAIFKSMLFLCAGLVIHSFQGIQDVRMLGNFFFISPAISSCMMISILSLMGFPFIGGFYSKDLIVEFFMFKMSNLILILIFLIGIASTFLYCSRLIFIFLTKGMINITMSKFNFEFLMIFPISVLCMMAIISGSLMNWVTKSNFNLIFISNFSKYFTLILLLTSIVLFFLLKEMKQMSFKMDFFYKIWHLSFLTSYILLKKNKSLIKISLSDWTWMEIMGPSNLKNNFYLFYNFNFWIENKNINKILLILLVLLVILI
uniref:NADH dehydrogenase subunit 5 n=1 Tax=Amblyomma argentinae TaxID=705545 RepID=UPI002E76BFF6|nr:NADH dehydrogenase subunit 5 [Amblyomma argentinae]WQF68973.1 NADH dehydrogenase subunit 5 [Amblyomma argentinae]